MPFFTAFFVSALGLILLIFLFGKKPIACRREARHIHKGNISRLGGVAMIAAFAGALLFDRNLVITEQMRGILFVLGGILLFGLWDDFWQLHWKTQLLFQVAIVVFTFVIGVHVDYITNPWGGIWDLNAGGIFFPAFLLVIFWIVLLINSINWVDGVDGLSGGITFIAALTIFFLSLKPEVNQPPVAIIAAAFAGSVLAFLIFNLHPARIFAGTSGAMFMGYILAVLAIFAGTKIATALLVLFIPVIDAIWVILKRIKAGKPVFEADNFHLHHRLLEAGWSQKRVVAFFYLVTFLIAMAALNTRVAGKLVVILCALAFMAVFMFMLNRRKKIHAKIH